MFASVMDYFILIMTAMLNSLGYLFLVAIPDVRMWRRGTVAVAVASMYQRNQLHVTHLYSDPK